MKNKEPKVDLEFDNNWNGILNITCPKCQRTMKKHLREIPPGKEVACSCGFTVKFSGDDLRGIQRSFDDLKRTLKNFGK